MDCKSCKELRSPRSVDFQTHQADMARMERSNKRLWVLCIVLALMLFASWVGIFVYESQYEVVEERTQTVTQSADGESTNRFIGGDYHGGTADDNNNL